MNFTKINYKLFTLSLVLVSFAYGTKGHTSTIRVMNKAGDSIKMQIIPEPISEAIPSCWKCLDSCHKTSGMSSTEMVVSIEKLMGREHFAVRGTQGGLFFNGECRDLNVLKDYEISFFDTTFGTSCVSKEI